MNGPFRSWISPLPPLSSRSRQPLFLLFHKRILGLFLLLLLLIAPPLVAQARDINVGSSAELADAIRNANDGDTIVLTADIIMTDHPPTVTANITVDGMGGTIGGNDRYRIFFVGPEGKLTIKNLTLTKGSAPEGNRLCGRPGWDAGHGGGAICVNGGSLTIIDSHFTDNSARHDGGAIRNHGTIAIVDSHFTDNSSRNNGGAIRNFGTLTISGSDFSGNSADYGGAIQSDGTLAISGSDFSGNTAQNHGGAISSGPLFLKSYINIKYSNFNNNRGGGYGGAVYSDVELIISNSSFRSNSSDIGAIYLMDHPGASAHKDRWRACISNSTFEGNRDLSKHASDIEGSICVRPYFTLFSSGNRFGGGGDYIDSECERYRSDGDPAARVVDGGSCPIGERSLPPPPPSSAEILGDPPLRISNCVSTATDTWFKLTLLGSEIEAGDALHVSIKAEDGAAFRHLLEVPRAVLTQEEKEEELLAAGEGVFVTSLVGEIPLADVIYNTAKTVYDVKKAVSGWNAQYAASAAIDKYQEFSAVLTDDATADREFLIHGRHENGGKMTVELTRRGLSEDENDTVAYRTGATPVCQYSH